ncbi:cysteine desulfurase [Polaribacter vadi]|uniref:cysteine desulfurase family protein n=1 Tax=Polaribacter TaxID=52959 RepID=UPI001C08AC32|nr:MULTISPECIES: cysteine desulfurase family protein [Polaribacter]MBU3012229.1 cysteine desulfurase [Polaribacter vadi]MDO6742045.1 cysteine desulfurase family protein [Polaribacter sp. 1_MG-2023]
MKAIYLDNAATTKIDDEVLELMYNSMKEISGNPSSTHQFGRKAKSAVETARKNIAKHFNVTASEIVFTAGGTEADNLILKNAFLNLGVSKIITSKIEHHAVLHTCEFLEKTHNIQLDFVNVDEFGCVDLIHLEELLSDSDHKTLVSLMHINNEIGSILPVDEICRICKKYDALFHSDTVQAIGHYHLDLQKAPIDFIVASAHKFHGPKGVGFAYFKKGFGILPMLHGGDQERGARSSTENVHSILGMDKALTIAYNNLEKDKNYIESLKVYFISELKNISDDIQFNGCSSDLDKSSYTILNVRFPVNDDMLLFSLDMAGIAVSGGSACQSGSNIGSHVLAEILDKNDADNTSVRFSFSKFTTKAEITETVKKIKELL